VRLYDLPKIDTQLNRLKKEGINIRRAMAYEKSKVIKWVYKHFGIEWSDECSVSFSNHPISCFIATKDGKIVGFACYESTCKNFFGPIGIDNSLRGFGIGKVLLLSALNAMLEMGYAYAIIGGGDGVEGFYESVGAIEIEGSELGIYRDFLK
jgi:GNAT superfamily N-acetyltransferase